MQYHLLDTVIRLTLLYVETSNQSTCQPVRDEYLIWSPFLSTVNSASCQHLIIAFEVKLYKWSLLWNTEPPAIKQHTYLIYLYNIFYIGPLRQNMMHFVYDNIYIIVFPMSHSSSTFSPSYTICSNEKSMNINLTKTFRKYYISEHLSKVQWQLFELIC